MVNCLDKSTWNIANFKVLHTDQIPSQYLILNQEEIYRPNMNTIEHYFHGESAVHKLLVGDASGPVPGANHQKAVPEGQGVGVEKWPNALKEEAWVFGHLKSDLKLPDLG